MLPRTPPQPLQVNTLSPSPTDHPAHPSHSQPATPPIPLGTNPFDSLPPELLDNVFEEVDSPSSLFSSALVCHRWRDPAQRALFQNVTLLKSQDALRWLASPLREHYRPKHLHGSDRIMLEDIIPECEGVRSLKLSVTGLGSAFEWLALPALSGALISPLSHPLERLLTSPPTPEVTTMSIIDAGRLSSNLTPTLLPHFHLSHLSLALDPLLTSAFLSFLLSPSVSTLSSLHLTNYTDLPFLPTLLPTFAPCLTHLSLSGSPTSTVAYTDLVALFPALETLALSLPFETLCESLPALAHALPREVHFVSLTMNDDPHLSDLYILFDQLLCLLPIGRGGGGGVVRKLELPDLPRLWREVEGSGELVRLCREYEVRLVVGSGTF